MSAERISERGIPPACLVCLFALVNAPPAVLLAWLLAAPSSLPQALQAATLTAGLTGSALLCVLLARRHALMRQALDDRTEQAERLRCVVESAAQPILTVDDDRRILSANAATARAFGFDSADLPGLPLEGLLSEADRVSDAKTDEQRILGVGRPVEAIRKDGSRFPASLAVTRTRQAGPALYVVLVNDLTELDHSRRATEAVNRSKNSFLGRVNHELRTPLAGILGTVELLRDVPGDPGGEFRRRLDVIQELGEALLRGFEQLAEYARLEAGQVEVRRQPFSLRQTVEQALAPLLPLARAKGLRLEVTVAPEVHDHYEGDAGRIAQVLMALVGNAVKFTPSGSVQVRVKSDQSSVIREGGNAGTHSLITDHCSLITDHCSLITLHFEVSDTGVGIPADRLRAIFEPFEQADGSSTRQYGGLGMGLSVASRLAALMGGRIDARSEPGKGSRFRFDLPLRAVGGGSCEAVSRSVLVVLAHDQDRHDLERHLGEWGIRAAGARTGRQALTEVFRAVVEGSPYGLVLIEEHLPDLSAREVINRLRHRGETAATPPVVMLGRSETDLPLPEGVLGVLPRSATPLQTYQAVLRAFAPEA